MDDCHFNYITKLKNKTLVKGVDVILKHGYEGDNFSFRA
jgi:hypothetical protein